MAPGADLLEQVVALTDAGVRFAVILVLKAEGSTPREAGARALVERDGILHGTIGGGAVEARALRQARLAFHSGRPAVFDFAFHGGAIEGCEPICGGAMRVLVDPTVARDREAYAAAVSALRRRERGLLTTVIMRGTRPGLVIVRFVSESVLESRRSAATFDVLPSVEALRSALQQEEARWYGPPSGSKAGRYEVFVEPVVPKPQLVIVGGGHVGQAVAVQASLVGFDIVVVDDRREFTAPALFPPGVTTLCGNVVRQLARLKFAGDTFVVIVTRGHQHDAEALEACLGRPCAYLGMIGSRRKVAMMRETFLEMGRVAAAAFDQVHAPIGLDIGAETVPEIAASIVAELIAVRRKGKAPRRTHLSGAHPSKG